MKKPFINRALKILLSTNAIILMSVAMIGPIYALYVEKVGGDLMEASLAGGIFALTAGITTLFSGKISDKIKESELIVVIGYFIMGIGFMLYTVVDSMIFLYVVQVIIGLGEAIYSPAFDSVYSKHLDSKQSGTQWGAWESMNYFTIAAGAVVGGFLVSLFDFKILFVVMALMCLDRKSVV